MFREKYSTLQGNFSRLLLQGFLQNGAVPVLGKHSMNLTFFIHY